MKRERLFYLDFVRAAATMLIVLTHFNAIYLYTSPQMPEKAVLTLKVSNVYIGDLGVSLFLIISGAALMYVYENECRLKTFFRKRFLNIYPMFWIGYVCVFLLEFYRNQGISPDIPKYKILYSIFGMDVYLAAFGDRNFYMVGEWFLGFIILFYLIFPALRKWLQAHPISLAVTSLAVYGVFLFLKNPHNSVLLPVLLPRILFGMFFVKARKKVGWKTALLALGVVILNAYLPFEIDSTLQAAYVGIAVFLIMAYLAEYLRWEPFRKICGCICKYSYAIFIIHHVVINYLVRPVNLYELTKLHSWLLFFCCCGMIFVAAFILQKVHDKIMGFFTVKE